MSALAKSLFISAYSTATFAVTAIAIVAVATGAARLAWLGVALVYAPMAIFFAVVLLIRNRARTHPLLPIISATTAVGLILACIGWATREPRPNAALTAGVVGAAAYLAYLSWYSRFGRTRSAALRVGATLPVFRATDANGNRFDSAVLSGRPAVLVFYRGNWCPLCMAQIGEIAAGYRELARRGVEIVLLSPQPATHTRRLAERFDVPFRFVVDAGNRIARKLGIAAPFGLPAGLQVLGYSSETVLPTVVVIDAKGRIVYCDETDNYRLRPEPGAFLEVLDAHQAH